MFVQEQSYLCRPAALASPMRVALRMADQAADIRGMLGFIFEPSIGDRDGDGYKDDIDHVRRPEDFDDFADEDAADPDNDDGILDDDDECDVPRGP